jgi:hypothetical protein
MAWQVQRKLISSPLGTHARRKLPHAYGQGKVAVKERHVYGCGRGALIPPLFLPLKTEIRERDIRQREARASRRNAKCTRKSLCIYGRRGRRRRSYLRIYRSRTCTLRAETIYAGEEVDPFTGRGIGSSSCSGPDAGSEQRCFQMSVT